MFGSGEFQAAPSLPYETLQSYRFLCVCRQASLCLRLKHVFIIKRHASHMFYVCEVGGLVFGVCVCVCVHNHDAIRRFVLLWLLLVMFVFIRNHGHMILFGRLLYILDLETRNFRNRQSIGNSKKSREGSSAHVDKEI